MEARRVAGIEARRKASIGARRIASIEASRIVSVEARRIANMEARLIASMEPSNDGTKRHDDCERWREIDVREKKEGAKDEVKAFKNLSIYLLGTFSLNYLDS